MINQILSASLFVLVFSLAGCNQTPSKSFNAGSKNKGIEIADTILYPVNVINLDSTDTWADTRLKNLHHKNLTDLIFKSLYSGNAKAYNYYTHEEISIDKIKEMEASGDFNRDEMAQLQFEETWFFNPDEGSMTKEVQSVLLAWPVYDNKGVFQAYKAGFLVELNP
ncbi:hypothetical protein [Marinilabilia rubra]|uniref:Uncharacterized protein n=1 Tax=Marinilabilia rubra TaxID=2162893 RepID=A0A2U2BEI1_9BACT|nr:hypothetical protein [Marinilabilia rubra]PWE01443.1 hypothetical protein DDZ16_02875 [Marinilabilia rubra]